MLTKAYVQEVISPYAIRIRMPLFNKIEDVDGATPNNELHTGCVCTLPNFVTNARPGDIVIVGFEEDNISKPVILGYLATQKDLEAFDEQRAVIDVRCKSMDVGGSTKLQKDTTIGEVKPENIECLKGLRNNVKDTFKAIDDDIKYVSKEIARVENRVNKNEGSINDLGNDIAENAGAIEELDARISTLVTKITELYISILDVKAMYNSLDDKFNYYLESAKPVFTKGASYGDNISEVKEPKEGQVYLKLTGDK